MTAPAPSPGPPREAVDADLDEILVLNNAAVPAVNELERRDLEQFLEWAHSFLVLDTPDGSIGGFLIGLAEGLPYESDNYVWFSSRYERFVYVDRVVVAPDGRGGGGGTRLYDAFAERGRADGRPSMLAEVNLRPRNEGSLRFHERHGFVEVGRQDTEGGAKTVSLLHRTL